MQKGWGCGLAVYHLNTHTHTCIQSCDRSTCVTIATYHDGSGHETAASCVVVDHLEIAKKVANRSDSSSLAYVPLQSTCRRGTPQGSPDPRWSALWQKTAWTHTHTHTHRHTHKIVCVSSKTNLLVSDVDIHLGLLPFGILREGGRGITIFGGGLKFAGVHENSKPGNGEPPTHKSSAHSPTPHHMHIM